MNYLHIRNSWFSAHLCVHLSTTGVHAIWLTAVTFGRKTGHWIRNIMKTEHHRLFLSAPMMMYLFQNVISRVIYVPASVTLSNWLHYTGMKSLLTASDSTHLSDKLSRDIENICYITKGCYALYHCTQNHSREESTVTNLPSLKPHTRMKTDVIQQARIDKGQRQVRHPAQLD